MDNATIERPIVLVPTRYFVPAYKAGGPIRSLHAMCLALKDNFDFRIFTSDRDYGDNAPFDRISTEQWHSLSGATVMYLNPKAAGWRMICHMRRVDAQVLYLNSFFDFRFTILPLAARAVGLLRGIPVIIAPRGELSPGAMKQKTRKKEIYLRWAGRWGLLRNVVWHASTALEKDEIEDIGRRFPGVCPRPERIHPARNLAVLDQSEVVRTRPKAPGELRAVFLSRISPKKNLREAIRLLGQVKGLVSLDVYGAKDPESYWQDCLQEKERHARNLMLTYKGTVVHEQVQNVFSQYDLFIFPTLGENFGHVILESLTAGCPVLVNDQTPWRDLARQKAGWDVSLQDENGWAALLQQVADMNETEHCLWRRGARSLGVASLQDTKAVEDHRFLFASVLGKGVG